MSLPGDRIIYAESCHVNEIDISLVHEYIFEKVDEKNCRFKYRLMNAGTSPVSEEISAALNERMAQMAEKLSDYCKKINDSSFNPAFRESSHL